MPERDGYIPGVPCWADTTQPDPNAAAEFYGELFGWEFENVMPPDSDGKYYMARSEGSARSIFDTSGEQRSGIVAAVGSLPEGAPEMATWNTYIWVDDADETASKVKDAGGSVVTEPFDVGDSGRMGMFSDPEGAVLCVWQPNQFKGAELVNDPGSVNFNGLNTRDIEGAKKFYPAVFGWEVLELGSGMAFWTLPGYGDHLETFQPGLREFVKESGGPPGFEDVVAIINPIPDDQPDTPAHWSVTFATDDADGTAEKATELGGKVIAPAFDAPWVRMTVLQDPQGATFIASRFTPENKDLPAQADSAVEAS